MVHGRKTLRAKDLFVTGKTPADAATLIESLRICVEEKFSRLASLSSAEPRQQGCPELDRPGRRNDFHISGTLAGKSDFSFGRHVLEEMQAANTVQSRE